MSTATILRADARALPLPDASVDSIVCDPPYGLEFMGKEWDSFKLIGDRPGIAAMALADGSSRMLPIYSNGRTNPTCRNCGGTQRGQDRASRRRCACDAPDFPPTRDAGAQMRAFQEWCEVWAREAYRVLKPGGYLLAFGGSRTWHRLVCAIEDAGFEIRDSMAWLYGSGFPKSLDVSKAIDKIRDWTLVERLAGEIRRARVEIGLSLAEVGHAMQAATDGQYGEWYHRGGHMFFETGRGLPSRPEWEHLRRVLPIAEEFAGVYDAAEREVVGQKSSDPLRFKRFKEQDGRPRSTFNNAVTAPATDDARRWQGWGTALKPGFEPIVVARKPLIGTVAANVLQFGTGAINIDACRITFGNPSPSADFDSSKGRWPTNVVLSHSPLVDDDGEIIGASRFFPTFRYEAKAPDHERPRVDGVAHPTVKPLELIRWLCRLVTPPGGRVLDMFGGSGTTGEAALMEGFDVVVSERDADYLPLIQYRADRARRRLQPGVARLAKAKPVAQTDGQADLFADLQAETLTEATR